jgi:hypothetical protein
MAEKNSLIEQMLENLVNGEQQKAEELFHEYVVAKSREIYEGLIEAEMKDDEEEEEGEEVEEAAEVDDEEEDEVEETLDDVALEADDDEMDLEKDDPTDDLAAELDSEMDDEEGEMDDKSEEELFQDLDSIVDELQARFDELKDEEMGPGEEEEVKDDFDLETVREYVEKVKPCDSTEHADNTKSVVDNMKNDMGGTSGNIAKGGEEKGRAAPKAEDMKTGNVNVPGGSAADSMSKAVGHGAEKKGTAEKADNTASLFRGRR